MKANTDRRGELRPARKADFMADLRETVNELVLHRRTSAREVRQVVNRTIADCQTEKRGVGTRTKVGLFFDGEPRSQGR